MSDIGMPLLMHGEVTDPSIDIFDRERVFIDTILRPLIARYPSLKIVMEHITTEDAVQFISQENSTNYNLVATITAHHLLYNRNDIFKGGICPHMYCLPILKREKHRLALVDAATSGSKKFFIGTDSAPHTVHAKEASCGCAGNYPSYIFFSPFFSFFFFSFFLYFIIFFAFSAYFSFFLFLQGSSLVMQRLNYTPKHLTMQINWTN